MKVYTVDLSIAPHKIERYYAGDASQVWARDIKGVSIRFPVEALRPFVTHAGVSGRFRLTVGHDHRLADISRVD